MMLPPPTAWISATLDALVYDSTCTLYDAAAVALWTGPCALLTDGVQAAPSGAFEGGWIYREKTTALMPLSAPPSAVATLTVNSAPDTRLVGVSFQVLGQPVSTSGPYRTATLTRTAPVVTP